MADIQLRFHKDMLVLSTPVSKQLERIGIDTARDNELTVLLEPEIFEEINMLEKAIGVQCLVTDTEFMTPARLRHSRMTEKADDLARNAIQVAAKHQPQHILVEIGPCGLPLDPSSKDSLNENRDQYSRTAQWFREMESEFDAYFLNGFASCSELRCALMGIRKVSDKPVFASVDLADMNNDGNINASLDSLLANGRDTLEDAASVMAEYGAQVIGFATGLEPSAACRLSRAMGSVASLPILVQLNVAKVDPEQNNATPENPYYEADTMIDAADELKAAGVQFLRAIGEATPSYSGALVAATDGDDVVGVEVSEEEATELTLEEEAEFSALAEQLRERINAALGKGDAS